VKRSVRTFSILILIYVVSIVVITSPDIMATACQGVGINYNGVISTGPWGPDWCYAFTDWSGLGGLSQSCIPTMTASVLSGGGLVQFPPTPSGAPTPVPGQSGWWAQKYVVKVIGPKNSTQRVRAIVTNAFGSTKMTVNVSLPENC